MSVVATGKKAVASVAVLGVTWWLFADTYTRHARSAADDRVIRFAHFGTYQDYELWRDVIAGFEREYPETRVRQEYVVGLADRYNTKMRQQILSHRLPDVALVQLGPFRELAEHFADLSDLLGDPLNDQSDRLENRSHSPFENRSHTTALEDRGHLMATSLDAGGLASFRVDGTQRGLPVSGGNLLIYCNVNCFERASRFHDRTVALPTDEWSIEDFHRTAKALTCDFDGDGMLDQFGFWLPRWIYYLPFIWSFGADLTDEFSTDWKVGPEDPMNWKTGARHRLEAGETSHRLNTDGTSWRLHGPEAERALAFYRELAVGDRVCPRDDEVPQLFQDVGFLTRKVGMCVNGPWFQPFLDKTGLADSYFVAHIPRGPAGRATRVTWDGVVMAEGLPTTRQVAAKRFIRFVLSKPVQDRIAKTGRALPALNDSLAAFVDSPDNLRRQRFVDALSYSRIQPRLPRFGEVDRAINRHFRRLLEPSRNVPGHRSETGAARVALEQLAADPAIMAAFNRSGANER